MLVSILVSHWCNRYCYSLFPKNKHPSLLSNVNVIYLRVLLLLSIFLTFQDAMEDPSLDRIYSGFDFKFFVQSTTWASNSVLQNEVDDKIWFPANVSRNVLFKSRDRMGTKKAKPLWTEIMNLLGDEYSDITKSFYATD